MYRNVEFILLLFNFVTNIRRRSNIKILNAQNIFSVSEQVKWLCQVNLLLLLQQRKGSEMLLVCLECREICLLLQCMVELLIYKCYIAVEGSFRFNMQLSKRIAWVNSLIYLSACMHLSIFESIFCKFTHNSFFLPLTLSWRRSLSYRNHSIDLLCKSMDWFLYDRNLCHERVKAYLESYQRSMLKFFTRIVNGC